MDPSITNPQDSTGLLVLALVAIVIPILVDLVTKRNADPAVKAWFLVGLSLVNGIAVSFITAHNDGEGFDWKGALFAFITSMIVSATSLFAVLKPVGISGNNGLIEKTLPAGVGSPPDPNSPYPLDPAEPLVNPLDPQLPVVAPGPNPATNPVPNPKPPLGQAEVAYGRHGVRTAE